MLAVILVLVVGTVRLVGDNSERRIFKRRQLHSIDETGGSDFRLLYPGTHPGCCCGCCVACSALANHLEKSNKAALYGVKRIWVRTRCIAMFVSILPRLTASGIAWNSNRLPSKNPTPQSLARNARAKVSFIAPIVKTPKNAPLDTLSRATRAHRGPACRFSHASGQRFASLQ